MHLACKRSKPLYVGSTRIRGVILIPEVSTRNERMLQYPAG